MDDKILIYQSCQLLKLQTFQGLSALIILDLKSSVKKGKEMVPETSVILTDTADSPRRIYQLSAVNASDLTDRWTDVRMDR
jgi:hypothetical protein